MRVSELGLKHRFELAWDRFYYCLKRGPDGECFFVTKQERIERLCKTYGLFPEALREYLEGAPRPPYFEVFEKLFNVVPYLGKVPSRSDLERYVEEEMVRG